MLELAAASLKNEIDVVRGDLTDGHLAGKLPSGLFLKNLAVFLENNVIYALKPTATDAGHLPIAHAGAGSFMTLHVNMSS